MRYLAIMHVDPGAFDMMAEGERSAFDVRTSEFDRELRAQGRYVHAEAVEGPRSGRLVRVRQGRASFTDGPFMDTKEHMIGFILFESRDLNDAISTFSAHPMATIGAVEIRPIFNVPRPPPLP